MSLPANIIYTILLPFWFPMDFRSSQQDDYDYDYEVIILLMLLLLVPAYRRCCGY